MIHTFFIETVGCQMNVLDSELVASALTDAGYDPAPELKKADIVLFNTCSVRKHAEDKIYSALGRLKHVKTHHPHAVIGVIGCMAQQEQRKIFQRAPHVDLVIGPGRLGDLIAALERISIEQPTADLRTPFLAVSDDRKGGKHETIKESFAPYNPNRKIVTSAGSFQAMVRIMYGCNEFCSYCVVPFARGPEQSRPADEIVEEVRRLVDQGCLEVTLLGQTVNGYSDPTSDGSFGLPELLARLNDINGIRRIRFVTNHPRRFSDSLLEAVRDLEHVAPYLHIPAQSGSDRMLKRMNRRYTSAQYRDMIDRIRDIVPEAAVTSDFIVGFSGETEEDFQETVDLVRYGRFKNSFIFKYSEREGTKAAEQYDDDVPYSVKQRRNNELLAVQDEVSSEQNQLFVGRRVEVLVTGASKTASKHADEHNSSDTIQLTGRTSCDRIVVFDGPLDWTGRFIDVEIEKASTLTLFGQRVSRDSSD
jgi:tRNA-2-methylthio-N6-dimethylallyladenosine synthase